MMEKGNKRKWRVGGGNGKEEEEEETRRSGEEGGGGDKTKFWFNLHTCTFKEPSSPRKPTSS
jgi:hypothetical protein